MNKDRRYILQERLYKDTEQINIYNSLKHQEQIYKFSQSLYPLGGILPNLSKPNKSIEKLYKMYQDSLQKSEILSAMSRSLDKMSKSFQNLVEIAKNIK